MFFITYLNASYRGVLLGIVLLSLGGLSAAKEEPWRLDSAFNLSPRVSLSGTHRSRYETLNNQFRAGREGGDQVFAFRTTLLGQVHFESLSFAMEMMDSRVANDDEGTPLSTTVVNPLELLQAYINIDLSSRLGFAQEGYLKAGRITMDVGSRRFVARNRFRNTINGFTGIDALVKRSNNDLWRAFYTLPVQRRVDGALGDNNPRFDREDDDVRFWGLYFATSRFGLGDHSEIYLLGLHEDDDPARATRNRDLYTLGFRIQQKSRPGHVDYQIESALQIGRVPLQQLREQRLRSRGLVPSPRTRLPFPGPAKDSSPCPIRLCQWR